MGSVEEVLKEVLNDITPTKEEIALINNISDELKKILIKRAEELNIKFNEMVPQGSTGIKQTQLRNDFDLDFFIGLDYNLYKQKYQGLSKNQFKKESKKDFLELCNNWIMKSLENSKFKNPGLLYAEHPYVTTQYINQNSILKIDIVLYFDLPLDYIRKNGPVTAVDRSPWHGKFIRDNLSKRQKDDVRLLKQFFKACHSYGDKSALGMMGFIGYAAELLIYHFGTIQDVFENFNSIQINPIDYFNRSKQELMKIHHFKNDALIITDPIDMNRNVASAISEKAYKYCTYKIQQFLQSPSKEFFAITPILETNEFDPNDPYLSNIFLIELENTDEEKHYTINRDKLYKLGETIKSNGEKEFSHVEKFGTIIFEVYFQDQVQQYILVLYCQNPKISATYERKGPPLNEKKHVDKFKLKNPDCFEKEGYLWVNSKRVHTDFLVFLNDFIKTKLPENLFIINISKAINVKTKTGAQAITILRKMVLPFYL
ncbi:MAG: hypothetical protein ACTSR8_15090 [Promethearchaeota archaeon]